MPNQSNLTTGLSPEQRSAVRATPQRLSTPQRCPPAAPERACRARVPEFKPISLCDSSAPRAAAELSVALSNSIPPETDDERHVSRAKPWH